MEKDNLDSNRQPSADISIETGTLEQINAQLAIRIKEVERRNRELGEKMVRRLPTSLSARPQTDFIDPAIGE